MAAYTLEEAGPIVTQGDEYTEVLGSADGCVVAPKAYMKEKNPMYLYSNTYGDVTELPEKVCKILRENKRKRQLQGCISDGRPSESDGIGYLQRIWQHCHTARWRSRSLTARSTASWQRTVTIWRTSGTESGMRRWRTRHSQSQR
ncbi:MAG: hypothetical protein ACLUD2_21415 [Clostridium sp.]